MASGRPRPAHHGRAERHRGRRPGRGRARGGRGPGPRSLAGHPPDGDEPLRLLRVRRHSRRHVRADRDDARVQDPRSDGHRAAGGRQPDGAHDRAGAGGRGGDRLGERGGGADAPQLGREDGDPDRRGDPDDARGGNERGRGPAGPSRHDAPHAGQRHQPPLVHGRGLRHQRRRRVPGRLVHQQPERGRGLHPQRDPRDYPRHHGRRGLWERPRVQLRDLGEPEHRVRPGAQGAPVELRGRAREGARRAVVREQAGRPRLPRLGLRAAPGLAPQLERVVREQDGRRARQEPLRLPRLHAQRPPARAGHGLQPRPRPRLLLPRLRVLPAAHRHRLGSLVGPDRRHAQRRLQPGRRSRPDRRLRQHGPERLPRRGRPAGALGPGRQGPPRRLPPAERRPGPDPAATTTSTTSSPTRTAGRPSAAWT